jgi:hypothetical protein
MPSCADIKTGSKYVEFAVISVIIRFIERARGVLTAPLLIFKL